MTIDINKVRVQLDSDGIIDHIELHANLKPILTTFLDRLEAAERERDWHADRCEDAMSECASLRARVEAMERQEPAGEVVHNGESAGLYDILEQGALLYALPGAPAQNVPKAVAYLDIGAGGYMDIGTDLTGEELDAIPNGRHMLGIVGTYGVDGYVPAQPAPSMPDVDALAQFIREVDGSHQLGAGVLAERIAEWLKAAKEAKP